MEKGKTKNRDKDSFIWEEAIQFLGQMDRKKTLQPNAQKGIRGSLVLSLSCCKKISRKCAATIPDSLLVLVHREE